MCHVVLFSLAARQRLEQRLAATPHLLDPRMNDITRRVGLVFPEGHAAVVQDLYTGYRVHEDEYVLLVELSGSGEHDGRYVVKLGPPETLLRELRAWRDCRPTGLRHDLVLMPVEPRPTEEAVEGLVYEDAQQFIGVDQTLTLEAAMLDAARVGFPTPESVADVLFQLFERLGLVMYRYADRSPPPDPRDGVTAADLRLGGRFADNLDHWDPPPGATPDAVCDPEELRRRQLAFRVRRDAQRFADDPDGDRYLDAADAFRAILAHVARGGPPAAVVPTVLRGRSHGDLHGRNVLVGRVGDRVLWPAVYDHEHMGRGNIVGLDFVKLEMEFKSRAYPEMFRGGPAASVPAVLAFERALFERTERCRDSGGWPDRPTPREPGTPAGPEDRLAWLILKVREAACRHLGVLRARSREWLAEYYFLLALYGLNGIRFQNLEEPQLRAGYLAAGAAAARFAYGWRQPTGADATAEPGGTP